MNIKNPVLLITFSFLLFSCSEKPKEENKNNEHPKPQTLEEGKIIRFSVLPTTFDTFAVTKNSLNGNLEAPAQVAASILKTNQSGVVILFDDPEINDLYSSMLQSNAHYKRDTEFYLRVKDMNEHGASTGRELIEANTGMIEAATELAEKEARMKMFGFEPDELRRAQPGMVWLLSSVNESMLSVIKTGKPCKVEFISYPGEEFTGTVTAIGQVLDNATQSIKVRVALSNVSGKFMPGMFATIRFSLSESNILAVPQSAIITALGKNYVFKKRGLDFIRTEVSTAKQIGDYVVIKKGLEVNDVVVTKGTILLKGLSFGY